LLQIGEKGCRNHRMSCQAYSDEVLSKMTTYKWYKRVQSGRTLMDDDEEEVWTTFNFKKRTSDCPSKEVI